MVIPIPRAHHNHFATETPQDHAQEPLDPLADPRGLRLALASVHLHPDVPILPQERHDLRREGHSRLDVDPELTPRAAVL